MMTEDRLAEIKEQTKHPCATCYYMFANWPDDSYECNTCEKGDKWKASEIGQAISDLLAEVERLKTENEKLDKDLNAEHFISSVIWDWLDSNVSDEKREDLRMAIGEDENDEGDDM